MLPSPACLSLARAFEGCKLTGYRDIAGVPTVGYGHTGPEVRVGATISQAQADADFANDMAAHATPVSLACAGVSTSQAQFDAMLDLAYNIGSGAFRTSSVLARHRAGDHRGAAAAFAMWSLAHVDGKLVVIAGLARRRSAEASLYLSSASATAAPVPADNVSTTDTDEADILDARWNNLTTR